MINGLVTDFPTEDLIDRIRLLDNNKLRMPISPSLQCLIDITEPSMLHIVGEAAFMAKNHTTDSKAQKNVSFPYVISRPLLSYSKVNSNRALLQHNP